MNLAELVMQTSYSIPVSFSEGTKCCCRTKFGIPSEWRSKNSKNRAPSTTYYYSSNVLLESLDGIRRKVFSRRRKGLTFIVVVVVAIVSFLLSGANLHARPGIVLPVFQPTGPRGWSFASRDGKTNDFSHNGGCHGPCQSRPHVG